MKNISFLAKHFQFLEVKCSIYLNRRVFVMDFSTGRASCSQQEKSCQVCLDVRYLLYRTYFDVETMMKK